MSQQGYSLGRDTTLTYIKPDGSVLNFGKVTKFTSKQESTKQKIKGIDGVTDNLRFFEGWNFNFDIERRSGEVDAYFAKLESNYYAGIDEPAGTLMQTITEPNGAVSQFRFERAVLSLDDAGDWAADKAVSIKVSGEASRRIQQA